MPRYSAIAGPDGVWSIAFPPLAIGLHRIDVRQVVRGYTSAPATAEVSIAGAPPTITGGPAIITSAAAPALAVEGIIADSVEAEVEPA